MIRELEKEYLEISEIDDPPLVAEEDGAISSVNEPTLSARHPVVSALGIAAWRARSRDLIWKKRHLEWDDDRIFLGSLELPSEVANLHSPFQFFPSF